MLGQTFFIFRLSRIPTVFFQEMDFFFNLDFFIADRMKIVTNLKKKTRNRLSKKLDFTMQKTLSVRKKALNPNFDYTCIYISVLLHQYVF